jgi:hypothetical protein
MMIFDSLQRFFGVVIRLGESSKELIKMIRKSDEFRHRGYNLDSLQAGHRVRITLLQLSSMQIQRLCDAVCLVVPIGYYRMKESHRFGSWSPGAGRLCLIMQENVVIDGS